jgi:hypothetical protein
VTDPLAIVQFRQRILKATADERPHLRAAFATDFAAWCDATAWTFRVKQVGDDGRERPVRQPHVPFMLWNCQRRAARDEAAQEVVAVRPARGGVADDDPGPVQAQAQAVGGGQPQPRLQHPLALGVARVDVVGPLEPVGRQDAPLLAPQRGVEDRGGRHRVQRPVQAASTHCAVEPNQACTPKIAGR